MNSRTPSNEKCPQRQNVGSDLNTTLSAGTFHGGRFFEAIGTDFQTLGREAHVISADVLDAWFDPAPQVIRKVREFIPFLLRTSPPIYAEGLVRAIARTRGLSEDSILTGAGSSDLLFS